MTSIHIIFILVEKYKCTYVQHCLNLTRYRMSNIIKYILYILLYYASLKSLKYFIIFVILITAISKR